MIKYILKRLLLFIPVLLGVSLLIYFILSLTPGNAAQMILGDGASQEALQALEEEMGLNDPFIVQYFRYLWNLIQGDLGTAYRSGLPVLDEISTVLPVTIILAVACILFTVIVGIPIGILSATKQYSFIDTAVQSLAVVFASVPGFWLGIMLILFFAIELKWFPTNGIATPLHYVLPTIATGLGYVSTTYRMTRSSMLEVIRQDYIRTARAKGADKRRVYYRHALRNALLPIVTIVGSNFALALGGTMITEQLFAINGLGRLTILAIRNKDTPLVLGCVLFITLVACTMNLLLDILYTYIDPRLKAQFSAPKKRRINA